MHVSIFSAVVHWITELQDEKCSHELIIFFMTEIFLVKEYQS